MPDYDEYDEQNESNGMKQLRKQFEKLQAELKSVQEENGSLKGQLTERDLGGIFAQKNVPAALQRIMKKDGVEASEAAVDKWLADNGSDFGWNPGAQKGPEDATSEEAPAQSQAPAAQSVLTPEDQAALARFEQIFSAQSGAPTMPADAAKAAVDSVASKIETGYNATSYEEVVRGLRDAGIPMGGEITY